MVERYKLSQGALREIMKGGQLKDPIMQVLGSKKISSSSSDKERYRILLSDGKYAITFAMFTTQVGDQAVSAEIPTFSVIKIKRYITSVINNAGKADKRVLVILEKEIVVPGEQVGEKLGNPETLPDDDDATTSASNINSNSATISNNNTSKPESSYQNSTNMSVMNNQITHPISSLSPYQNKWIIRAKVQFKSPIRTWSNSRGEGKLFSMDLIDESGEIRATGFRDAVDKFYNMIEVDKVYYISKCQLKIANKQFTTIKNDYEMTLTNETVIQECQEEVQSIPKTKYDFLSIDKVAHIEPGTLVDVIGVCKQVSEVMKFQAKATGRELIKREVTLVDQSLNTIDLTLWGAEAENFDGSNQPVIAIRGAKVSEFGGGKTVSTVSNCIIKLNPDLPEAHRLKGWYENGGLNNDTKNISAKVGGGSFQTPWMSFREVTENGLSNSEKGDYYQTVATILLVKAENCVYKACPSEQCNKKVVDMENGMYRCEKCNRDYPNYKYRLLVSMNLADWSGNQWVNVFADEAEKILGHTSTEIGEASEAGSDALMKIIEVANFKRFLFKFRSKMETYNDETRLKTVVFRVEPIDYKQYNAYLLSKIDKHLG